MVRQGAKAAAWLLLAAVGLFFWPLTKGEAQASFQDVSPGAWYAGAVQYVTSRGIMHPAAPGRFDPGAPVTRGELAGILDRALNLGPQIGPRFSDVTSATPDYQAIETVAGNALMQGTGPDTFDPGGLFDRAQAAVVFAKAAGLEAAAADLARAALPYGDAARIPSWAAGAVQVTTSLGLLQGWGGAFHPDGVLTRAEVAVLVQKLAALTPTQVGRAAAAAATRVTAGPAGVTVNAGQPVRLWALVQDAHGFVLPVPASWAAPGGQLQSSYDPALTATVAHFTPGAGGSFPVTVTVPGTHLSATVQVAVHQPTSLAFGALPAVLLEEHSLRGQVQVLGASGQPDPADNGRSVALSLQGPAAQTATVQDQGGSASFSFAGLTTGSYTLTATAAGLTEASFNFRVVGQPLGTLTATAPPQLSAGATGSLRVTEPGGVSVPLAVYSTASGVVQVGAGTASGSWQLTGGAQPGTAQLVITAVGGAFEPADLTVTNPVLGRASFPAPAAVATAGSTQTVPVDLSGSPSGVPVTLTVTAPGGWQQQFTADTVSGTASFPLQETLAGSYGLQATAPGYAAPSAGASLTVQPGPAVGFQTELAPSGVLVSGEKAQIRASLVDRYGNPVPGSFQVGVQGAGLPGVLTPQDGSYGGLSTVATFAAGSPGEGSVTVTAPGYAPVVLRVRAVASPAAITAGKGMWLMYADWKGNAPGELLAQAKADGIRYLYLEVATSRDGFYGGPALESFLAQAHAQGIAVLAWVYADLTNPAADTALARQAASFTTPWGVRADGVAADLEGNQITAQTVTPYAQVLAASLGSERPLVAVTYPPQMRPNFPFAALAPYTQVFAPMDYWHAVQAGYSYQQVYQYVADSVSQIRSLSGDPTLPVSIAAQAYDMYGNGATGAYSPTGLEERAAVRAARAAGAEGISFYRWGTASSAEWSVIATAWPGG